MAGRSFYKTDGELLSLSVSVVAVAFVVVTKAENSMKNSKCPTVNFINVKRTNFSYEFFDKAKT